MATGYGQLTLAAYKNGKHQYAHRMAYELANGPLASGMTVDHECHNRDLSCPGGVCKHRLCCNPAHLVAKSDLDNIRDSHVGRNRLSDRTHCKNGHEFTEKNTRWVKNRSGALTVRQCRQCALDIANARYRADKPWLQK